MTYRHSSRLIAHLGSIALALAASQAGATTYSVPLQFTMNLAGPTCSLTVGTATADANAPAHATGVSVDLTPTPLSVIASPNAIVGALPGFSPVTAYAPGIDYWAAVVNKRMDNPPTASATCTSGTPMTARLSRVSTSTNASPGTAYMAGTPGSGQAGTLPIGLQMGIASFAGVSGVSGQSGVTYQTNQPAVSAVATGSPQPLNLTVALYANSTTTLTASYAGLWTYSFNVNLDF